MNEPESTPEAPATCRGRFQIGLRLMIWVIAAVAVWFAVFLNVREGERLASKIDSLRAIARDLVIDDPGKIAVVKLDDLWDEEQRWDVYLPPGSYRIHLATREIGDDGLPKASATAPIRAGRHRLGLFLTGLKSGTRIKVLADGADLMSVDEAADWIGNGWTSRNDISTSEQRPADQILELHRRQLHRIDASGRSSRQAGPVNGLLLWIEPTGGKGSPSAD